MPSMSVYPFLSGYFSSFSSAEEIGTLVKSALAGRDSIGQSFLDVCSKYLVNEA